MRAQGRTGAFKALFVNGRSSRLCHIPSTTGFFGQGTGGVGLSGRRGEIGNHKVAGKIVVMTLAARPRNHENAAKSRAWRRFSLPSTLQRSARRTANLSKECRRGHLFFCSASADCLPSRRRLNARCSVDSGSSRTAIGRGNSALSALSSVLRCTGGARRNAVVRGTRLWPPLAGADLVCWLRRSGVWRARKGCGRLCPTRIPYFVNGQPLLAAVG